MSADLQIDHLMNKVDSPQDAGAWFERCGFTVTPLSVIGSMGLCNRLVLFEPAFAGGANFIELMGTVPGAPVQPAMGQLLAGEDGTRSMVLVSQDANATQVQLAQRGFAPAQVHHVTRQWDLPGESLDLAFDVILPMPAPLTFNVCRYYTLQHYLRPQWLRHANGVLRISSVMGVVEDVAQAATFYERLLGVTPRQIRQGHMLFEPGAMALELFSQDAYSAAGGTRGRPPGFSGYRLSCVNARETKAWFAGAGVSGEWVDEGGTWRTRAFGNDIWLCQGATRTWPSC